MDLDLDGKQKGSVIMVISRIVMTQHLHLSDPSRVRKVLENYSLKVVKKEVDSHYSAFKGSRNLFTRGGEKIVVSEKNIHFFDDSDKWLYFLVVWMAASLARTRVVFEFLKNEDRNDAQELVRELDGMSVGCLMGVIDGYREAMGTAREHEEKEEDRRNEEMEMEREKLRDFAFLEDQRLREERDRI